MEIFRHHILRGGSSHGLLVVVARGKLKGGLVPQAMTLKPLSIFSCLNQNFIQNKNNMV